MTHGNSGPSGNQDPPTGVTCQGAESKGHLWVWPRQRDSRMNITAPQRTGEMLLEPAKVCLRVC